MDVVTFPIVEIFTSVQGEGCNLGKQATFIRFAGCNLKCPWCDTDWSTPKEGILTVEEIVARIPLEVSLVVLTGGEPTIQSNLKELIGALYREHEIAIETNGTRGTKELIAQFPNLWIACSPKPPRWMIHRDCVYDELKYVVDGRLCPGDIQEKHKPVWLQPEGGQMQRRWNDALIMQQLLCRENVRIGIQLHKIMEVR